MTSRLFGSVSAACDKLHYGEWRGAWVSQGSKSWLADYARSTILSALKNSISVGHIIISDSRGTTECGESRQDYDTSIRLKVVRDVFWVRVLMSGDVGFSEAYMFGDIELNDLNGAIKFFIDNHAQVNEVSSFLKHLRSAVSAGFNGLFGQSLSQARLNAISSYDQSNELFKAFLSQEMMYSCGLWSKLEGGVRGDLEGWRSPGDLEAAQLRKIHHVLTKARVRPGHRILEFGSGWGAMAIEAASFFGCEVDTLTLSVEQKKLAEERVAAAGLSDKIRVHLMDYRDIPESFRNAFDAFVSIEMLEHVGSQYYDTYFKLVDFALKKKNATVVVSSSTFPECRYREYQAEDFMRKYMWPNSCLPSATALVQAALSGSSGNLTIESIENHAAHYPRTLREWGRRLDEDLTQDRVIQDFPALQDPVEYQTFKRKWEYLFAYAGAGFAKGYITCHMLSFSRPGDVPMDCD
ncbi:cyclopropane-fatty-acyl-phospholipid synthase [Pterulicium gracile]|uniref:Cyclopropane-fatty-acyl-phospholipid synthase n=1 Tax=Pterulicium gracile TaxID=1884261 RepID=A0A5C3Q2W4_9AGAR|nr:cyclopropane-fatty-acyl-phospholipid synthase [Pterula gracilis]